MWLIRTAHPATVRHPRGAQPGGYARRMRLRALLTPVLLVGLVGLVTGCGSDPEIVGAGRPAPRSIPAGEEAGPDLSKATFTDLTGSDEAEVQAVDNNFRDEFIEVEAGTTITFDNRGRNAHDVVPVVDGAFATIEPDALQPAAAATITLDQPGDYAYYCSLHGTPLKGMTGAIRVVAAS